MKNTRVLAVSLTLLGLYTGDLSAGARSKIPFKLLEKALDKFGREVAKEGVEVVGRRLLQLSDRVGPDVIKVFEHAGPRALKALEAAGADAPKLASILARHGPDAAWLVNKPQRVGVILQHGDAAATALVRHRQIGEAVIEKLGQPGAQALATLNARNGRRLAMLLEEGKLLNQPASKGLLNVIGEHGDKAMEFIWNHKGALAVTACLVAFVHDPKPFLEGVRDLAQVVGQTAIQPVTEGVREAARQVNWTLIAVVISGMIGAWWGLRVWSNKKRERFVLRAPASAPAARLTLTYQDLKGDVLTVVGSRD